MPAIQFHRILQQRQGVDRLGPGQQLAGLGLHQDALGVDLLDQLARQPADRVDVAIHLSVGRLAEKVGIPGQAVGNVADVVQKDPFEGLAAFLVADVQGGHDSEGFAAHRDRRRPDAQVQGLTLVTRRMPALPDISGAALAAQDGVDRAAGAACFRRAAAIVIFEGVRTTQDLAGAPAEDASLPFLG